MFKINMLITYFASAGFANTPDIQEIISQSEAEEVRAREKAYHLLDGAYLLAKDKTKPCGLCQDKGFLKDQNASSPTKKSDQKLLVFVSSSMPGESLKSLFIQAQEMGATLVFRGLIGDSFKKTKMYFDDLKIIADINPPLFDDYQITQVPSFVLREGDSFDIVQGNISFEEAMLQIKSKGELKKQAKKLLDEMKEARQ